MKRNVVEVISAIMAIIVIIFMAYGIYKGFQANPEINREHLAELRGKVDTAGPAPLVFK